MDEFERNKVYVQWMLGNSCNYNCSYCLDLLKRGDYPPPDQDLFIEVCKEIISHYDNLEKDVVFDFTGGEPTLMEKIPEMGRRLHNYPNNIILRTNGSASLEWWRRCTRYLSEVVISVHREYADLEHIQKVIEYITKDKDLHPIKLSVLFPVTIRPESWEWGVKCVKKFKKKYDLGEIQLLYSNFGRGNNQYLPYKEEQWDEYHKIMNIERVKKDPNEPEFPSFTGQKCHAGLETLIIDAMGNVYRGWCLQGNKLGNINELPLNLPTEPIICEKTFCKNKFDQMAKKEN